MFEKIRRRIASAQAEVLDKHLGRMAIRNPTFEKMRRQLRLRTRILSEKEVDLWRIGLSDEDLMIVTQALRVSHTIESLQLGDNEIGVEGARAMADVLKENTSLQMLDLHGNNIGVEGARAMADALKENTSLRTMNLYGNNVGSSLLSEIQSALSIDPAVRRQRKEEQEKRNGAVEFEGSMIQSLDELEVVVKIVEKRRDEAEQTASTTMTADSVTCLQELTAKLDCFESLYKEETRILPSLAKIQERPTVLSNSLKHELETLRANFRDAQRRRDYCSMKQLGNQVDELKAEREKMIRMATTLSEDATRAYQTRCEALGKEGTSAPEVLKTPSEVEKDIEQGRLVVKEALESKSIIPAKEVAFEYLNLLTQNWKESSRIARGGQGYVYRGFDEELNCAVAIKQIPFAWDRGAFHKELTALSKLEHPNVVRLLAFSRDDGLKMSCLVYEYAAGGSMADVLNDEQACACFPWQKRVGAVTQLVLALQYCHNNGVKHRDVKPQNVCFTDEDYRDLLLIDFGVATEHVGTLTSFGGTNVYSAPEYITGKKRFDEKTEVHAVGVVMLALITGKTSLSYLEGLVRDLRKDPTSLATAEGGQWDADVLSEFSRIASQCLRIAPSERPTMQEILDAIVPLRGKSIFSPSVEQEIALNRTLEESMSTGTTQAALEKFCACGRKADDGVACLRDHAVCALCLEGSVRRQFGSELIRCHVGCCNEHFDMAELKGIVSMEILAQYALYRQQLHNVTLWNENMEAAMRRVLRQEMRGISSGIAFVASSRNACPSLCILWPSVSGCRSMQSHLCKEYRMYFLCAFDRTPTKSYIVVKKNRDWVRKVKPVLKYSLLMCKVIATVIGLPLPLPRFIPGNTASEQTESLVQSLADLLEKEDFREWAKYISDLRKSQLKGEAELKRLLSTQADKIDADAHGLIQDLAKQAGNRGWEDEMVVAHCGNEWAWVKAENKERWESQNETT